MANEVTSTAPVAVAVKPTFKSEKINTFQGINKSVDIVTAIVDRGQTVGRIYPVLSKVTVGNDEGMVNVNDLFPSELFDEEVLYPFLAKLCQTADKEARTKVGLELKDPITPDKSPKYWEEFFKFISALNVQGISVRALKTQRDELHAKLYELTKGGFKPEIQAQALELIQAIGKVGEQIDAMATAKEAEATETTPVAKAA